MVDNQITPLLSVVCCTYNHVKYIEQTLKSFVMQQTDFPFEVILGDDGSDDGTTDICALYAEQYPGIIRHQIRDRKVSLAYGPPGKYNSVNVYKECRGKYIAICDGDDFYSNPHALQLQFDLLEANPDYGMVYGGADILQQESGRIVPFRRGQSSPSGEVYNDLFIWNFIKTCTVCLRKTHVEVYTKEMARPEYNFRFGDYFAWLYVSSHSKVGFIDELIGTYRIHSASLMNIQNMKNDFACAREKYRILSYYLARYGGPYTRRELLLFYFPKAARIAADHNRPELASCYQRYYYRKLQEWNDLNSPFQPGDAVWF